MKAVVVGFGAMGKIVKEMLQDDFYMAVAPECEVKNLSELSLHVDVIIDFSSPKNLDMIYDYAICHDTPVVFATTGYTNSDLEKIARLSQSVPVLRSANFSLGVILLNRIVREITPILKNDFDIEIVEAHHHFKVDAPSGTAKMLLDTAIAATGYEANYGREGYSPRKPNEIGVHAVRGGSIVGEHDVMYCGEDEVITIKHSAQSKKIFAKGAIKAAKWLIEQEKGYYDMEDVLFN